MGVRSMQFFVGGFKPEADLEKIYEHYKSVANSDGSSPVTTRRIFRLIFQHDGDKVELEVGKTHGYRPGQTIAAIFEAPRFWTALPITPDGRVVEPIYAGTHSILGAEDFDSK
jgi:hypothetical protein